MRKILFSLIMLVFSGGLLNAQAICGGQTVALQAQNPMNLTGPSYSMQPGSATSPNGLFIFTPSVTSNYTLYTSGTTSSSPFTFTTTTAVVQVTVHPQPVAAPSVTNLACNTTSNCWDLNLTFQPALTPQFTITWAPPNPTTTPNVPPEWNNPETSQCGTLTASTYTAIITAEGGCVDSAVFTILPPPLPADFTLAPLPNYVLTCFQKTIDIAASNPTLNYTYNSAATGPIIGPSVTVTFTNVGTWSVTGVNSTSGCVKTVTFAVTENTVPPTGVVSPTFQNITCTSVPQTITMTAVTPTVNFTQFIFSPHNTTFQANSTPAVYPPAVGIYTYVMFNNATGCFSSRTFTVANSANDIPTFSIVSAPGGFSVGCGSKSVTTITFVDAQTNPTPGGAISYTLLPPGDTTAVPPGPLSTIQTFPLNAPGSYTGVVMDNANNCITKGVFSIVTNTVPPGIDSMVVPRSILDCDHPTTIIEGFSKTPGVSYAWQFPSQPGVGEITGNQYTVNINPLQPLTNLLIANHTLTIQEDNNRCISRTVVPIYQNLFPPKAFATAGSPSITCAITEIQLTNFSESRVPSGTIFPTGQSVDAILWLGPSPSPSLANSSSYVAKFPGDYTMTVKDRNNGCESTTIVTVFNGVEIPRISNSFSTFPMDCGAENVVIRPTISTATNVLLTYSWTAPPSAPTGPKNVLNLVAQDTGRYYITIRNEVNQCVGSDSMYVSSGTLTADIAASKEQGFAPLDVSFVNNSVSKLGNSNIETVWSFGTDSMIVTKSASVQPSYRYTQPGNYTVTAYVRKGDCLDTAYSFISVDIPSQIVIPNVFTPNGDGINDLFFLQRSVNLSEITAQIYDRWGNLVYEVTSSSGNIEWDGKNQVGKETPSGTYFYIIKATGKDGASYDEKGNLTLVR